MGIMLGLTGFISAKNGKMVDQPEAVVFAIKMAVSVIPFLLSILAAWLISYYDIEDE